MESDFSKIKLPRHCPRVLATTDDVNLELNYRYFPDSGKNVYASLIDLNNMPVQNIV